MEEKIKNLMDQDFELLSEQEQDLVLNYLETQNKVYHHAIVEDDIEIYPNEKIEEKLLYQLAIQPSKTKKAAKVLQLNVFNSMFIKAGIAALMVFGSTFWVQQFPNNPSKEISIDSSRNFIDTAYKNFDTSAVFLFSIYE